MAQTFVLSDEAFETLQQLVNEHFGILLTRQKRSLILARLQSVLRVNGFKDFEAYIQTLKQKPDVQSLSALIDKISTNHTFFNREAQHFEFLRNQAIPQILQTFKPLQKPSKIRIWSAGCASGEEPFQIIMELMEAFGQFFVEQQIALLATDISAQALSRAQKAVYDKNNVQHLPPALVQKYFVPIDAFHFQLKNSVRQQVLFRRFNLARKHFPFKHRFHIIFCRNVMIYFDAQSKQQLLARFYDYLEPGGFLFLGHSENIARQSANFHFVQPAVYQKKE